MSEPACAATNAQAHQYSGLDRLLHRVAFAHPGVQKILADVETDLFAKRLKSHRVHRPVFITGLPRAGTTLLLELLYNTTEFASYTYRNMPFVLAPLLWDRITRGSRQASTEQERAHGDGMTISVDSPEAFEEVLWSHRLADTLFHNGHQQPLQRSDLSDDFCSALKALMLKMTVLSEERSSTTGAETGTPKRYLSKNNANLARLEALGDLFPEATVLLCFRHPETHVASLCHQHDRFARLHDEDAFSRQYMAWTAHHDFGANFIPIDFAGRAPGQPDAGDHRYWLQYWVDAYRHVLEHADDRVLFVGYEALLEQPRASLDAVAHGLRLQAPDALLAQAPRLRPGGSRTLDLTSIDSALADEARGLYATMSDRVAGQRSIHRAAEARGELARNT